MRGQRSKQRSHRKEEKKSVRGCLIRWSWASLSPRQRPLLSTVTHWQKRRLWTEVATGGVRQQGKQMTRQHASGRCQQCGGCTDAGSRRRKTTVRSSTGTSVVADADGGTTAPVDAAKGGLLVEGARFLPVASAFSSPATARDAMVTVTLAQPSIYFRPGCT